MATATRRAEQTVSVDGREIAPVEGAPGVFYYLDMTRPEKPRADFVTVDWAEENLARVGRASGTVYTLRRGRAGWMCSCKAGERGLMCYHKRVMRGIEILFAPTPEERGKYLMALLRDAIEEVTGRPAPR